MTQATSEERGTRRAKDDLQKLPKYAFDDALQTALEIDL
jgi:hypothetical protein